VSTAIRKHLRDFIAVILLVVVALIVTVVILSHQRLALPPGVPILGKDFVHVEAELQTAQAVTPGQGQTVNIAGVEVGQISDVKLEDGKAVIGMDVERKYMPIYNDATILLRPKTGLKDMVAEMDPGTKAAGELPEGTPIPASQTLPDVNLDEILSSLDADTRDYLRVLLGDAAIGLHDNGRRLAQTIRRIEPTARYSRKLNEQLATRRRTIKRVVHNFSLLVGELGRKDRQLADFVENSNAVFAVLASQDANLRASVSELPGALDATTTTLAKVDRLATVLGPTLTDLDPGAQQLDDALRQLRPFLTTTTPILKNQIRPFTRAALPTVKQLRPALNDLAAATPDLTRSFKVINVLLNTLAYNPPGQSSEGYLFWLSWLNHISSTVFSTQDAHGPIRAGVIVLSCSTATLLNAVAGASPQLGTLVQLLNAPPVSQICPTTPTSTGAGG
jgi:phospholipid/cholesterol/gamma-HCH transport system substrate-binding protein